MAKTVEVDLEVKSNLEPTIKNLKLLKNQLKETAAGSKEFDKLSASIRDMEDAISDAKATNDDFLGQLENASGPLGTLGQGIRAAERTFSSFNGALKASIIGLVVSLVAGLAAAFNDNEKAQKKLQPVLQAFEKILGGVFAVVEPLFDTFIDLATRALPYVSDAFKVVYSSVTAVFQSLGKLGSAVKKLIGGDFSGAWEDAKSSVTGFSKNFNDAKGRFEKGSKEMTKTQREEAAKQAEENKKRQEEITAKNKAEYEKRLAAQKEANKLAKEEREKAAKEENEFFVGIDNANRERRVAEALLKEEDDAKVLAAGTADADRLNEEDEKNKKRSLDNIAREQAEAQAKTAIRMKALDDLTSIFGAESRVGKAFLIAKQLLQAKELAMEISKTITFSTQAAARSTVAVAEGTAQTAKVGFPQNIPMLIGYAAQAAGIFGAIRSAVKSAKSSVALPSMPSISEGGMSSSPASVAPTFNVVGTSGQNQIAQTLGNQAPIKAFVVANDVSTQQSLDRNIVQTATLGD